MFDENWYDYAHFVAFLQSYQLKLPTLRRTLEQMVDYDGQYTKPEHPLACLGQLRSDNLPILEFVQEYIRTHAPEGQSWLGSKEVGCEEWFPYFLENGARVIHILRDPRDVLVSLNQGRGTRHAGTKKPDLFNLRQWRKSVAFAARYIGHPDFLTIRYEDLVTDPAETGRTLFDFLGERPLRLTGQTQLLNQDGTVWEGNSSHFESARIETRSVERYGQVMTPELSRFVQACCYHEMRWCGYTVELTQQQVPETLRAHCSVPCHTRPELRSYIWSTKQRQLEERRFQRLTEQDPDRRLLIFEELAEELIAGKGLLRRA